MIQQFFFFFLPFEIQHHADGHAGLFERKF